MPAFSFSFNNAVRADTGSRIDSLASGKIKTGKEVVRENLQRLNSRSRARQGRVLAKFVAEEGKGVKLDISA